MAGATAYTEVRDISAQFGRIKTALRRAVATSLGRAIGLSRAELKASAPVWTGQYRNEIQATPVEVRPGRVWGAIVWAAPHSVHVWRRGYHEGMGRNPDKRGLLRIRMGVLPLAGRLFREEAKKAVEFR